MQHDATNAVLPTPDTAAVRGRAAHRFDAVQLGAVLLAGLLIRLAFIQSAGYRDDMVLFYAWFKAILSLPPSQVYAHVPGLNYPPAFIVISELSARILRFFVHGDPSEQALNVALKLPSIVFDVAGAGLAYAVVRRRAGHAFGLAGAAFIALNPAIIYDSAFWGQNDSIPAVLALFAIAALCSGNAIVAWLSITVAVLVKPPVLVLVPLMLLYPFAAAPHDRRRLVWQTGVGVAAAFVLTEILAYLFFPHPTPVAALRHLFAQLAGGASYFPVNSLNAFNVWAVFGPFFASDRVHFLGLSMHLWGDLLFTATAAAIYWRFVRARNTAGLFEASALVLLAFFLLLTEMHERYLYYAVVFFAVLVFKQPYRIGALALSVTLLLNLEYSLTFMYLDDARATVINRYEFAPWLVHLCSLTNIGLFLWLLADYLGLRRPADRNGVLRPEFGARNAATTTIGPA